MRISISIAEPASHLEIDQSGKTFCASSAGTLSPYGGSIFTVPGCGVDEAETPDARGIQAGESLCNAAAHGTTSHNRIRPLHVIEQLREVAREQFRREL